MYLGLPDDKKAEYESKQAGGYRALAVMEHQLNLTPFLLGEIISLADISLFAYTHVAHEGGFDLSAYRAIRNWIQLIKDQKGTAVAVRNKTCTSCSTVISPSNMQYMIVIIIDMIIALNKWSLNWVANSLLWSENWLSWLVLTNNDMRVLATFWCIIRSANQKYPVINDIPIAELKSRCARTFPASGQSRAPVK